jgi:ABC-type Zn uptake system ZnuABC Zn-binding protein ZnuA
MRSAITLGLGLTLAAMTIGACGGDSESGGGDSAAAYCARIQAYKDETDKLDAIFDGDEPPSSDDLKKAFTTAQDMVQDLAKRAPAEIKSDATLMSGNIDELVKVFEKYDWDIVALASSPDMEALDSIMSSTEADAASERLDKFSETSCGIKSES